MKLTTVLPLAAASSAFVLPTSFRAFFADDVPAWWESLPSKDVIIASWDDALRKAVDVLDGKSPRDEELVLEPDAEATQANHGSTTNFTLYQLITESNHTTKFAALVDKFDDVVSVLNSTDANYTLFVPTDAAFDKVHRAPDGKKPSDDFLEKLLKYHVGAGLYPAGKLIGTPTLPTVIEEKWLGYKPQRLRTSFGLGGIRINLYSKVVAANIPAKNGVLHAISKILVPPTFIGAEISLLPNLFSTLLLAYDKTDFVSFIHGIKANGTTVFAPTNAAFEKLGPAANAFLFNTPKGLGFLKALLKYQIVANATLYSNALYENDGTTSGNETSFAERSHVELTTLLKDTVVGVDITRWGALVNMKLNGYVPVVVRDGIALNGVVQVVGRVPLPPKKPGVPSEDDGEISVDELVERLQPYVGEGPESEKEEEWLDL